MSSDFHSSNSSLEEREETLAALRKLVNEKQQQIEQLLALKDENREHKKKIREFADKVMQQKTAITEKNKMISKIYLEFGLDLENDFQINLQKLVSIAKEYNTYKEFVKSLSMLLNLDKANETENIQEITQSILRYSEISPKFQKIQTILQCSDNEMQSKVENLVQNAKLDEIAHNHIADILEMNKWDRDTASSALGSLKHNFKILDQQFDKICSLFKFDREKTDLTRDIAKHLEEFDDIVDQNAEYENQINQLKEILHSNESEMSKLLEQVATLKRENDLNSRKQKIKNSVENYEENENDDENSNLVKRLRQLLENLYIDSDLEETTQKLIAENVSNKQILEEILDAIPERSFSTEMTISDVIRKAIAKSDVYDQICDEFGIDSEEKPYEHAIDAIRQMHKSNPENSPENKAEVLDKVMGLCKNATVDNLYYQIKNLRQKLNEISDANEINVYESLEDALGVLNGLFGTNVDMKQIKSLLSNENSEISQKSNSSSEKTCIVIENVKELKDVVDKLIKTVSTVKTSSNDQRKSNERKELLTKVKEMKDCIDTTSKILGATSLAEISRKVKELKEKFQNSFEKTEETQSISRTYSPISKYSQQASDLQAANENDKMDNESIKNIADFQSKFSEIFETDDKVKILENLAKMKNEVKKGDDDQEILNLAHYLFVPEEDQIFHTSESPRKSSKQNISSRKSDNDEFSLDNDDEQNSKFNSSTRKSGKNSLNEDEEDDLSQGRNSSARRIGKSSLNEDEDLSKGRNSQFDNDKNSKNNSSARRIGKSEDDDEDNKLYKGKIYTNSLIDENDDNHSNDDEDFSANKNSYNKKPVKSDKEFSSDNLSFVDENEEEEEASPFKHSFADENDEEKASKGKIKSPFDDNFSAKDHTKGTISPMSLSPMTPKLNNTVGSVNAQFNELREIMNVETDKDLTKAVKEMSETIDNLRETLDIADRNLITDEVKELKDFKTAFCKAFVNDPKENLIEKVDDIKSILDRTRKSVGSLTYLGIPDAANEMRMMKDKLNDLFDKPKDLVKEIQKTKDEVNFLKKSIEKQKDKNSDQELLAIVENVSDIVGAKKHDDVVSKVKEIKNLTASIEKVLSMKKPEEIIAKVQEMKTVTLQSSVLLNCAKQPENIPEKLKEMKSELAEIADTLEIDFNDNIADRVKTLHSMINDVARSLNTEIDEIPNEIQKIVQQQQKESKDRKENLAKLDEFQDKYTETQKLHKKICSIFGDEDIESALNSMKSVHDDNEKLKQKINKISSKLKAENEKEIEEKINEIQSQISQIKEAMRLPESITFEDLKDQVAVMYIENGEFKINDKKLREIFNADIDEDTLDILKEVEKLKKISDKLNNMDEDKVNELNNLDFELKQVLGEKTEINQLAEKVNDMKRFTDEVQKLFSTNEIQNIKGYVSKMQDFMTKLQEVLGFDDVDLTQSEMIDYIEQLKQSETSLRQVLNGKPEQDTKSLIKAADEKLRKLDEIENILNSDDPINSLKSIKEEFDRINELALNNQQTIPELFTDMNSELNDLKKERKLILETLSEKDQKANINDVVSYLIKDKKSLENKLAKLKENNEKFSDMFTKIKNSLLIGSSFNDSVDDIVIDEIVDKIRELESSVTAAKEEVKRTDDFSKKVKNELRKIGKYDEDPVESISRANSELKKAELELKREIADHDEIRQRFIEILEIENKDSNFDEIEQNLVQTLKKQLSLQMRLSAIFKLPENHQSFSEICIAAKRCVDQLEEKSSYTEIKSEEEHKCERCEELEQDLKAKEDLIKKLAKEIDQKKKEVSGLKDEVENLENEVATVFSKLGPSVSNVRTALERINELKKDSDQLKRNEYKLKKSEKVSKTLQQFKHEQTEQYREVANRLSEQADFMKKTLEKTIKVSNENGNKQLELASTLVKVDEENRKLVSMLAENPNKSEPQQPKISAAFARLPTDNPLSKSQAEMFNKPNSSPIKIDTIKQRTCDNDDELNRKKRKLSKIQMEINFSCNCQEMIPHQPQTLL